MSSKRKRSPRRTKKEGPIELPKRIQLKWLQSFDMQHIPDLTKTQAERVLKSALYQSKKKFKEFSKYDIISPAYEAYYGEVSKNLKDENKKFRLPKDASQQQLWHEIEKAMMFVRAKTSTVKGAIEFWQKEESRILGPEATPMTEDQRKRYWSAYMQFMRDTKYQYKDASERIQQYLGQMGFWREKRFTAENIAELTRFAETNTPPAPDVNEIGNVNSVD